MKRPLFVFAGQSNMMGAGVFPAKEQIEYRNSFEYLHKARRFGRDVGEFKPVAFPVGEFSYADLTAAYGRNADPTVKSTLADYQRNAYFGPAMHNVADEKGNVHPFAIFSEATTGWGVALPPYFVEMLEAQGHACAYTHIAKGSVGIKHYLEGGAAAYFDEKVTDFFSDSHLRFSEDDTTDRVLIWLQGSNDAVDGYMVYYQRLEALWERARKLGFTHFFMIRVCYWGDDRIADIMRAQEDFCAACPNAYMLTRVGSYLAWYGQDIENWYVIPPTEEMLFCRDSYYGFDNQHINEKGYRVIAKYAVPNVIRILFEKKRPILEKERLRPLLSGTNEQI